MNQSSKQTTGAAPPSGKFLEIQACLVEAVVYCLLRTVWWCSYMYYTCI